MQWRGPAIAVLVLGTSAFTGAVASSATPPAAAPQATCSVPAGVSCTDDNFCVSYGARCDLTTMQCFCALTGSDLGSDLGSDDGGGGSGGGGGGGSGGTGGTGGGGTSSGMGPTVGGGMVSPPKTGGCSFVPGSAG